MCLRVCSFCVDLQLTKIGNIVYNIQDTADRKTLSEAKQSKQAFNRILCVIENCLHSLFTSSVITVTVAVAVIVIVTQTTILIEINSKTFFWFICFSFVCWLQTLRFDFRTESRFHEEYETKERAQARIKTKVFGNKVNGWSEFSLVLQCSLKIVKCVRVALHSSIELCAREPIEAVNFQ